jgi:hypothetical protein
LQQRYGLKFEEGEDDLDRYELAAIPIADGGQLWLLRYRRAPSPGTVVYADSAADPAPTREQLLAMLGLSHEDLSWWPASEHRR